jgi:15-cis-phytoene synthase
MPSELVLARDDRLACREWIRVHSKSFYLSSLLLPAEVRHGAWALYAFCRRADDAVDENAGPGEAMARVDGLRRRLDAVYGNDVSARSHPIDRAFSMLVTNYRLPRALPEALLAGMEMDARGASYESDDDLLTYCFRVASTVGLMMTRIMGCSHDVAWLRAADLGVAMQLTNIARDVGEDARRGRVYLPASLCREVGMTPRDVLSAREATPPIREAVRILLARADAHYRAADLGVPLLPRGCRLAIASSRLIYSRIGAAIARNNHDSITQRAYVSLPRKLLLVTRATAAIFSSPGPREWESTGPADAALSRLVASTGLPTPPLLTQPVPAA